MEVSHAAETDLRFKAAAEAILSRQAASRIREADLDRQTLERVWAPRMLSILRIVTALLFIQHGTQKLFSFPPSDHPAPELFSLLGFQGLIELVGGILVLVGQFTRPVAFVLSGDMAVAYFMAHAPKSIFPVSNGGDAAVLYCFVFLYLALAGGGSWELSTGRASGFFIAKPRTVDERTS